jgi:hypothetical protein
VHLTPSSTFPDNSFPAHSFFVQIIAGAGIRSTPWKLLARTTALLKTLVACPSFSLPNCLCAHDTCNRSTCLSQPPASSGDKHCGNRLQRGSPLRALRSNFPPSAVKLFKVFFVRSLGPLIRHHHPPSPVHSTVLCVPGGLTFRELHLVYPQISVEGEWAADP